MSHKDEIWGTTERRTLAFTRALVRPEGDTRDDRGARTSMNAGAEGLGAFGPEAYGRAQANSYELITRIQQESPYVAEEVVEHVVHDRRLYVGMWITGGVAAVSAFLTFSVPCLITAVVAVVFALSATPGRQSRD
ncbi:hypothetical protein [Streptomyces cucumeris]|uniref:hypothetical protein n=1 Tax=Streptomyces cucumeris TaxID=2962890 RepID=UPI0020C862D7|nr:hypothetical protein [Streptomyces sp. NEAU-Y11]MCP9209692.1 hypothetical protein [Streptomyces sp. NEAU-Y11]